MADEQPYTQTARLTGFLGWPDGRRPPDDDPAENFHEASKNVPGVPSPVAPAAASLIADPSRGVPGATAARPVRRNLVLPTVDLPAPELGPADLGEQIQARRSRRSFGTDPVSLQDLSTILHAGYGVTARPDESAPHPNRRSVPSGGGLYPLEIFIAARNVDGLEQGLYHYDPHRAQLEDMRHEDVSRALRELLIELPQLPDMSATCGAIVFIAGAFWRTRFKYGLRGYRWALIEAGHVGQNMLLSSGAVGLNAFPFGGFWDGRVDQYLGLDGVNESIVYSVILGSPGD
ncbi:MAG: SagB family peptide dehydrogenase [Baekduia sp.]